MLINSVQVYKLHDLHGKTCTLQTCFEFLSTYISITIPKLQVHRIFRLKEGIMYELFLLVATSPLYFPA